MKPSPKITRSRKNKKVGQNEPSTSNVSPKSQEIINDPEVKQLEKERKEKRRKKRRHDEERAEIPRPSAAKKRKTRNLTGSSKSSPERSSSQDSDESGSSQGSNSAQNQHSLNLFNSQQNSGSNTSSSFLKYLKVHIISHNDFCCSVGYDYFKDVRSKAIKGNWRKFDYQKHAEKSRFKKSAQWLLEKKPHLEELLFNGIPTGYFKCCSCESQGDLHIIKAYDTDQTKMKMQFIRKHMESRSHLEVGLGKVFQFSKHWKKDMDKKYLQLMATQRVSGKIFRTETFIDIIVSWINQVSSSKIDSKTVLEQLPSRTTLRRRMLDLSKEQTGKFEII